MKKLFSSLLILGLLVACSPAGGSGDETIKVYTRDGASGTREAFESIIGLESLTDESAETSGNGDMAKQVGANKNAIGYVSLTTDFEANNLKALQYEGVEATIDSVNKSDYQLARPFSYVTRAQGDFGSQEKEDLVLALIDYIENSKEGREVVLAAGGIVDVDAGTPWDELKKNHPIVDQDNSAIVIKTGGSTSVEKTLNEAVASFIPMAGNFKFEPNHTGSGDGFKRTLGSEKDGANTIDIGFASREFKAEETVDAGLKTGVYSKDAVVVVAHKDNEAVTNLTASQLVDIFGGKLTKWSDIK
ncbi:substrate-binding domain-containing protein [Erysipelothrix urinaevulpis]|uniref:substrate-binding domain-containing protein n=1 Tax=Erysipelothrix urinaevulpis TaxID=2683717 RepID=UPI001358FE7B|nr:substrate-binding domain-containing protein [Erysipelothrix urinaevulpis]